MLAWIDIENPPQAQYLCPFVTYLQQEGRARPVVTVRDYGSSVDLVRNKGIEPIVFGRAAGASKLSKIWATLQRATALARYLRQQGIKPEYLISSSRASALVGRLLEIPTFIFCDYEFAELGIYRRLGATILHPAVIGRAHFQSLGFRRDRLFPFPGLKEDISFAFVDLTGTPRLALPLAPGTVRVLLRPPATRSHYYRDASGSLYLGILPDLAGRSGIQLILSPRYPEQAEDLERLDWEHPPIVLDNKADFVALLKLVDVVVASGGTMLREAAYLGIQACSIFMGAKGAVDCHLADRGLLQFVRSIEDFRRYEFRPKQQTALVQPNPDILAGIIHEIETNLSG